MPKRILRLSRQTLPHFGADGFEAVFFVEGAVVLCCFQQVQADLGAASRAGVVDDALDQQAADVLAPGSGGHHEFLQLAIFAAIAHGQVVADGGHAQNFRALRAFCGQDDFAALFAQQHFKRLTQGPGGAGFGGGFQFAQ